MRNFKLTVCYDGTRYRGWQRQGNTADTVQARLEALLSRLLDQEIHVHGSGRTDAGVHARQQVCSFTADTALSCPALLEKLRAFLPEDLGAVALEDAPPRFHARLSCRGKTYVYRIWNSASPNVFQRRYLLFHPEPLDLAAMEAAAQRLVGRHDFASFCTGRTGKRSTVRQLREIRIWRQGEELRLRFTADGFLYNMVRILVGTLLEVGEGRRSPESVEDLLSAPERRKAGPAAAARGLCLWEQYYDDEPW